MAAIVDVNSRHGLRNELRCINQTNKSKLALYKPLLYFYSLLRQLYMNNETECLNYKAGRGVRGCTHIKVIKRGTGLA